jgi:hypothetical protein
MGARTTDDLVSDVRARVAAPASAYDGVVPDSALLELANEELRGEVASLIMSTRSQYWVRTYEVSITIGLAEYRLPDRALGQTLHDVTILDANGQREYNAVFVPTSERYRWTGAQWAPGRSPFAFALENGKLVLIPVPSGSGSYTLRMRYYERPSQLVATSSAAAIVEATSTTQIELAADPPADLQANGSLADIVRGDGMFEATFRDRIIDTYGAPTLDVDASTPVVVADIATATPGGRTDYVCLAGQSVYPPVPETVYPYLVAVTARAYAEAVGDARGMQIADMMATRKREAALGQMLPRVDGEPGRVIVRNTVLRGGRAGVWGGGWR